MERLNIIKKYLLDFSYNIILCVAILYSYFNNEFLYSALYFWIVLCSIFLYMGTLIAIIEDKKTNTWLDTLGQKNASCIYSFIVAICLSGGGSAAIGLVYFFANLIYISRSIHEYRF